MFKQITSGKDLVGKTIKRYCYIRKYLIYVFKDSTFVANFYGWDRDYDEAIIIERSDIIKIYPDECCDYKLITKKECEKIKKTKEEEMKQTRLINYKILKEEFGDISE